jgi:hypothetical protein
MQFVWRRLHSVPSGSISQIRNDFSVIRLADRKPPASGPTHRTDCALPCPRPPLPLRKISAISGLHRFAWHARAGSNRQIFAEDQLYQPLLTKKTQFRNRCGLLSKRTSVSSVAAERCERQTSAAPRLASAVHLRLRSSECKRRDEYPVQRAHFVASRSMAQVSRKRPEIALLANAEPL